MYVYTSIRAFEDGHDLRILVAVFSRCEYLHSDLVMQRTLIREECLSIRYIEISHDHFSETGNHCYRTSFRATQPLFYVRVFARFIYGTHLDGIFY